MFKFKIISMKKEKYLENENVRKEIIILYKKNKCYMFKIK